MARERMLGGSLLPRCHILEEAGEATPASPRGVNVLGHESHVCIRAANEDNIYYNRMRVAANGLAR